MEVVLENLQTIEDEGEMHESIEEVWSDYPTDPGFPLERRRILENYRQLVVWNLFCHFKIKAEIN